MKISQRDVFLVSGPCSAESLQQLRKTAEQLQQYCRPDVFRAGAWKARTNINTFDGYGEDALRWMKEVKDEFGFPLATEVLMPNHVDLCLKYGIDYVWLGARIHLWFRKSAMH